MTTLYTTDVRKVTRVWSIEPEDNGYTIIFGIENGAMQTKFESVPRGKANRTIEEQIKLEIQSRINKQIDKGYRLTREEAVNNATTNALGLYKPMLAQTYDKVKVNFNEPVYIQRKYDGCRCIISKQNDKIIAYSRNGKLINTIDHIISSISLENGQSIDGELYTHGATLQEIVSFVKRAQPESKELQFHAYDIINTKPFEERYIDLHKVLGIHIVETRRIHNVEQLYEWHNKFRAEKYEGTIIRHTKVGYEDGKRSKSLLKLKDWNDGEFLVIDIIPSKDGWARLVCQANNGRTFNVAAPGMMEEKDYVYTHRSNFIGEYITIEYAYLTEDGIPFHPVAKVWRT